MQIAIRARMLALLFVLSFASSLALSQTISQPVSNFATSAVGGVGQSFVATLTGVLVAIDVHPVTAGSTANLLIYNGGNGSGTVGAVGTPTYTQPNLNMTGTGSFIHVTLTTPFPVVAGNAYTFFFQNAPPFGTSYRLNLADVYAGGTWFSNYAAPQATLDLAFQLYEVATSDLQITQTASSPVATVGSTISYTVTLTNAGPGTATTVTVADNLAAAGLTLISAQSSIGTLTTSSNALSLAIGLFPAAASGTITVVASVGAGAGSVTHTVSIQSPTPDTVPANNTSSHFASRLVVVVAPVLAVASIPTLGEWALVVLAAAMMGLGMYGHRVVPRPIPLRTRIKDPSHPCQTDPPRTASTAARIGSGRPAGRRSRSR